MLSNKLDGPRRGRSFDSINKSNEEKQLNNEVRRTFDIRVLKMPPFMLLFLHFKMLIYLKSELSERMIQLI